MKMIIDRYEEKAHHWRRKVIEALWKLGFYNGGDTERLYITLDSIEHQNGILYTHHGNSIYLFSQILFLFLNQIYGLGTRVIIKFIFDKWIL